MFPIVHSFFDPSSRWYYPLRWLVLILLGLAIYAQTFGFAFVFDDFPFIVNNPFITRLDYVPYNYDHFPPTRTMGFYSFALNYLFNQLHPQGYHIFNFAIHLLAVGLVWATCSVLFKIVKWGHPELPFIIAVLFLVHPCQTQAVTYISQRFESMATVFYLSTIYFYLCARISSSKGNRTLLFACSAGFAILGILTKEVAATIPLMVLAVEFILFNRGPLNFKKSLFLPITILGIMFGLLFMGMVHCNFIDVYFHFSTPSESHDGDMITCGKYLLTQPRVFLTFLRLLILPVNQNLDYDYPLSTGLLDPPLTLVGLCLIGFIAFLIVKLRKKWPLIALGLAWILITFSINTAPRSNIIFEHKLYLISFGFFLTTVCALSAAIKNRRILFGLLIALIAVLSLLSYKRNHVWKNELTLWEDVIKKSPHKARPYDGLGTAYDRQGNLTEALSNFNKAIAINPDYAEGYYDRGVVYQKQGDLVRALSDYNKAIEINPGYADAYSNRGGLYNEQGNPSQAIADSTKAIEIDPDHLTAYANRGVAYVKQGNLTLALDDYNKVIEMNPNNAEVYYDRGNIHINQGDPAQALSDFNNAIAINPNYADAYNNRGNVYKREGNLTQAMSDYNKTIEIDPDNVQGYINRGILYDRQGQLAQAWSDYNKAIEIDSKCAEAYNNRGNVYGNQGDLPKAFSDFYKAIEIDPDNAQAYSNLAAAYYLEHEYGKAWENVHKAKELGAVVNPDFINKLKKASGKDQ